MRKVGIKTTQIMDYMVQQLERHQHVGFTPKNIYSRVNAICRI